jgi:serine/threonine-protein kinase
MIDTSSQYLNQQGVMSKKKNPAVIIIVVVLVAAVVGGIFMLRQPKKTNQTNVNVVEKKEPSPTEKPKIDKESVKIQVLNGTGTPGQAGITVEALKKAGYNSDNIKTGNAEKFDNSVVSITARTGFKDVASDIKDALKTTFDEIEISSSQLDKGSEFDIVVTTGGKIFEEVTPTASITNSPTETLTPSPTPTPTETLTPSPTPTP